MFKRRWAKQSRRPFRLDAACDNLGHNRQDVPFYCCPNRSFLDLSPTKAQSILRGDAIYVNPPFRKIGAFADKLIELRDACGTESMMITPWDPKRNWFTKVCANFELHSIVKGSFVCPNGQRVFSRPTGHGSSREEPGSSPYDVAVWFSKPVESEDLPNFYNLPFLGSTFEERAKSSTRLMAFRCRLNGVNVTALP